ncbi:YjbQ family protein [Streptomyces zaomyceticus]|uniref:YjbQ family protein n=1 Tax=Streptomyces zaomyceticus TaxID=68286 RepID=UPI0034359968
MDITTGTSEKVYDLTRECASFLADVAEGRDRLLNVFAPHATMGVALIETGAGSDDDLLTALHHLLPADERWQHRHGSRGHGRDNMLPAIVPPHATLLAGAGSRKSGVPGGFGWRLVNQLATTDVHVHQDGKTVTATLPAP